MKRLILAAFLALILLLALGCAAPESTRPPAPLPVGVRSATPMPAPAAPRPPAVQEGWLGITLSDKASQALDYSADRMIVRNINMTMTVNDMPRVMEQVAVLAQQLSGFVVSSSVQGEGEKAAGFITIRVPTQSTEGALAQIRAMAVKVVTEQSNAQDVTEEYIDLQSRLRNLQAAEAQYLDFLRRASTVEDLLKVQSALTSVQGQIEQIKGRMQYLERTSSMSLITVALQPASGGPLVQPGWSPLETAKTTVRSLSAFGQGLADGLIRVVIFAPVWLPLLAVASLLTWALWRRMRKAKHVG